MITMDDDYVSWNHSIGFAVSSYENLTTWYGPRNWELIT